MTDLPTPTASRLRKPPLGDPRLVVGVVFVLLSTIIGSFVVAGADDRVPMWRVAREVTPGTQLTEQNLEVVEVQLGEVDSTYLSAGRALSRDLFAVRELRVGELVPVDATSPAAGLDLQPVVVPVSATAAEGLAVGSIVDVYVNTPVKGSSEGAPRYGAPALAFEGVAVAGLPGSDESVLGGAAETRPVAVAVAKAKVPDLVANVDSGAKITLVPVPGSRRAAG